MRAQPTGAAQGAFLIRIRPEQNVWKRLFKIVSESEVAQWLACWAHNPKAPGSKPGSAMHALMQHWPAPCATQPIPHSPASLCWNLRHFYRVISGGKGPNNNRRRSRAKETRKRKKDRGEKGTKGAKKTTNGRKKERTDGQRRKKATKRRKKTKKKAKGNKTKEKGTKQGQTRKQATKRRKKEQKTTENKDKKVKTKEKGTDVAAENSEIQPCELTEHAPTEECGHNRLEAFLIRIRPEQTFGRDSSKLFRKAEWRSG